MGERGWILITFKDVKIVKTGISADPALIGKQILELNMGLRKRIGKKYNSQVVGVVIQKNWAGSLDSWMIGFLILIRFYGISYGKIFGLNQDSEKIDVEEQRERLRR